MELPDDINRLSEATSHIVDGPTVIDQATPALVAQINQLAQNTAAMQPLTLTMQSTMHALIPQLESMINPMVSMAQAFDNAKNDDFFFLSPEALETDDVKTGLPPILQERLTGLLESPPWDGE